MHKNEEKTWRGKKKSIAIVGRPFSFSFFFFSTPTKIQKNKNKKTVFSKFADAGIEVRAHDCVGHGSTAAEKGYEGEKGLGESLVFYLFFFFFSCSLLLCLIKSSLFFFPQTNNNKKSVPRYSYLVEDLRASVAKAFEERPGVPLFLGGHSMGGLVATLAALGDDDDEGDNDKKKTATAAKPPLFRNLLPRLSGLFLSSPALDVEWTPILRIQAPIGGVLSALVPRLRCVPAVDPKHLCRDAGVVEGYRRDPLNFVGNIRARTANELLRAFKAVVPLATRLRGKSVPTLVIFGGEDKIASLPAARRFVDAANADDEGDVKERGNKKRNEESEKDNKKGGRVAELVVFPEAYHELFFGPDKEEAVGLVLDWIGKHSSTGGKSVAKM